MQRHVLRTITACVLIALYFAPIKAQPIITVSSGSNFYISNGTTVSFDSLVLTPSAAYNITGTNSISRSTSITHTSPSAFVQRTFKPASPLNNYSGAIRIYYRTGELNALNASQLQINIYGASTWNNYTSTTGANYANVSGLSNITLGEIALASSLNPLPLQWLSINIRTVNEHNQVNWSTSDEVNCKHFIVQKSSDGRTWTDASHHIAANNTPDAANESGIVYYRIKQQSADNTSSYSIAIVARQNRTGAVVLYPNPATERLFIDAPKNIAVMRVYNQAGQIQLQEAGIIKPQHSMNVFPLPKGRYTVMITYTDGTGSTQSFIR
jgi:type IX secretion system substrate protein